ncbi:MAG: PKD domain-containing protein [Bacteroidia bacterium]|nr:PKD domain-containing protein [Bacteroidia bacterium]MCZ2247666.1 GEVED domain-containing protein [Bacteroidia bacterium]
MNKNILISQKFGLFLLVIVFCALKISKAQVASPNYTFSTNTGTYTPITGGTVVALSDESTQIPWDIGYSAGLPIGFTFKYNGVNYTDFSINMDGYISMGNQSGGVTSNPISNSIGLNNVISGFGRDLVGSYIIVGTTTVGSPVVNTTVNTGGIQIGARVFGTGIPALATVVSKTATSFTISAPATSSVSGNYTQYTGEIRYQTIGSAPARTLVVQWKNAKSQSAPNQWYNFQIRLNEIDNSVQVTYGSCSFAGTTSNPAPQVGLRGNNNSDYNNRRVMLSAPSSNNWNTSEDGTANSHNCITQLTTTPPTSGRSYIWTPPAPTPIDISVVSLVTPSESCGNGSQVVTVRIKNEGTAIHDFSVNPTTVTVDVTGVIVATVTATINTGTLGVNSTQDVICSPTINMSANGTYSFLCSQNTIGDPNNANDDIPTVLKVISRNTTFPYIETFSASPNPAYAMQTIAPNVSYNWAIVYSSTFVPGSAAPPSLATANNGFAVFNSYSFPAGNQARLILPCMDFSALTSPTITISMAQDNNLPGKNDYIRFEASTDGGNTWSLISGAPTCYRYNASAGTMFWQDFSACLSAYAGNPNVRIALRAFGLNGFNMAIDQITIENSCPTPNTLTAGPVGYTTATLNWNPLACSASSFDVEYGPAPSGPYTLLSAIPGNSTNLIGLTPATNYHFRVRTNCGGPVSPYSPFEPFTTTAAPPPNDDCPGSVLTPGLTCSYTAGTTVNATSSGVSAPTCGGDPDDDVWYTFTAPSTNVTITAQATSGIDIVLTCYQDNSCVTPTQVGCVDNTFAGGTEVLNLNTLVVGNTYRVRVFDKGTAIYGTFNICVTYIPPPPANDNCLGAFSLTPGVSCVNTSGTVENATLSSPATACGGNANDDVWYKFVATSTSVSITGVGALGMDIVLELLEGSCGTLNSLACANLSGSGGTEVINQGGLTAGSTYYIRVYDYGSGYPPNSNFDICVVNQVVLNPPPANDLCGNAIGLTSNATCIPTAGTTVGATNSGLPGSLCGGFVGNPDDDVWYSFVASSTAHDIIVVPTAPLNAVLELRTAACNGALIQCVDGAGIGGTETLSLQGLTIGTTYRIRVYGRGAGYATQGNFDICVVNGVVTPGPANDNCAGAISLTPSPSPICGTPTPGTVLNATQSTPPTTCFGTNNDDVWYKFVATQSIHKVTVVGSASFDAIIEAFNGACGASGIACMDLTGNGGTEELTLTGLTVGNTYYVRVFDVGAGVPATLTFTICVTSPTIPAPPANDNCGGAISLIAANGCVPYLQDVSGATLSPQSTPSCGGDLNDDVWYKFTAAQASTIIQATGQGNYDMAIAAYSGTCVSMVLVDCVNNYGDGQTETLILNGLTIGQTYYLRVYDYDSGVPLNSNISICVVNIVPPPVPMNDLCDDAIPIYCGNIANGQNSNGGTSLGDPVAVCGGMSVAGINGIWYRTTGNGDYFRLSTCNGTNFNTKIAVYTGSCASLTCLASNDDYSGCGNGQQSQVSWQTTNGVEYYILVGGFGGAQGIFQLKLECFPCITPTVAGTINVTPVPATSTVNDSYTLSLSGNTGDVLSWEFSLNNFMNVSSIEPTDGDNDIRIIDRINGTLYARAKVQNGPGCLIQTTPVVSITPRCASSIANSPSIINHYITNVEFNTINNNSTYDATGDNYQNFQSITTNVQKGFSYQLNIKTFGGASLGRVAWIDLNGDGDFSDAGENVLIPQSPVVGTSSHIITIPCTGINGPVRMRVMVTDGTPSYDPCDATGYNSGEIEEYTLNVLGSGYGNWIGISNDWCDPGNWACNTIPNGSIDVIIPSSAAQIVLNCEATCRNITFNSAPPYFIANGINTNGYKLNVKGNWLVAGSANARVSIVDPSVTPGSVEFNSTLGAQTIGGKTTFDNLTINNTSGTTTLTNTTNVTGVLTTTAGQLDSDGKLVLRSVTGKTALVNPMAGTITGNVSVERKVGSLSGYHYLSSPVTGAMVNNTTTGWRDDFTINAALNGQIFIPGASYTQLATVWEYDETNINPTPEYGWIGATGATTPITPLKGFACIVPGNTTVDVFGSVINGSIPGGYNLTRTSGTGAGEGINLIGNPYPSPISWNLLQSINSSVLSSVGYRAFITSGGYAGSYGSWNGTIGTGGVTDVIASSQAFLVTALTTGTINVNNSIRKTSYSDLNANFFSDGVVPDLLRMDVSGNGFANDMALYFDPTASDSYDSSTDAGIMLSPIPGFPHIFTVVDSHNLSINRMGAFNSDKIVDLGLIIQANTSYTIRLVDASTFSPSVLIYLEDTQTGDMINLRNQNSYTVTLPIGTYTTRFKLHFKPAVSFTPSDETCSGNDGSVVVNYPSAGTFDMQIKDQNNTVISTVNGVSGSYTVNNLNAGNYVVDMTLGTSPDLYYATDFFTIDGGNSINASLSTSITSVDLTNNQAVDFIASAPGAISYNWDFGDGTIVNNGSANISHTYNQVGNYTVMLTVNNGLCSSTQSTTIEVINTTGIASVTNKNISIKSDGQKLMINFNHIKDAGNIEIFDLIGKRVYVQENVSLKGTKEINLNHLANGNYLVKVSGSKITATEKINVIK